MGKIKIVRQLKVGLEIKQEYLPPLPYWKMHSKTFGSLKKRELKPLMDFYMAL